MFSVFWFFVGVASSLQFFHLTDIHIEPFYDASQLTEFVCRRPGCTEASPTCVLYAPSPSPSSFDRFGRPGCDPPLGLLRSMLANMKAQEPNPQFIVISGDYNGHNLPESTIITVQNTVFDEIRKQFPTTRILPGIGNNDDFPKNTNTMAMFTRLYSLFSQKGNISESERGTFEAGGYWHWHDLATGLRVIMLNSNLVYSKSNANTSQWRNVSQQQFVWLEEKLQHARSDGSKVIIDSHVPPTRTEGLDDWLSEPMAQYRTLIEQYSDTILLQIFGHHSTELIRGYSPTFGLSVASGFAPRTSTVPTFQLIKHNYTAQGQAHAVVNEISSYYLDLIAAAASSSSNPQWPLLYQMTTTYGVPDVSPASIYAIANKIVSNQAIANKYLALQMRSPLDVLFTGADRTRTLCEVAVSSPVGVGECVARLEAGIAPSAEPASDDTGFIVGAVLLTVALLTVAGGAFFLLIRKRAELEEREMLIGS